MTSDKYRREFKAQVKIYNTLKSNTRNSNEVIRMICVEEGENYLQLAYSVDVDKMAK